MKKIFLFAFAFAFFNAQQLRASHIAGGDLTYTCIGPNQYPINLNLFVDCLGFDPGTTQTVSFTSTCGGDTTIFIDVLNPGGTEISQLCAAEINNSTCNGGNLPGMWVFHYTGTVTLNPVCDTWSMNWSSCCRNDAILNLETPGSFGSFIQATLNSATAPCNNSPFLTSQPIPYVCANQLVSYNYGVVEIDGDSLYYSLIPAQEESFGTPPTNLAYTSGYTALSPIPGISINPLTGLLTFTPTTIGSFVVVVLIQEYDSNGALIGTVMRDIQFVVQSCSNMVPDPNSGSISSLTGTSTQTGPYSLELCEGSTFVFNATYTDPSVGDSLTIISNISTVLPGSTFVTSGANPLVAIISWSAPVGSANTNTSFSVTVNDGACPVQGQQTFVYDINVLSRTSAGPNKIICGPQTTTLHATGGTVFNWNVISGPPMVLGVNFSCNPCANPVVDPDSTTTYEVVSDLSGTCLNKDTVTVSVVPDFSFNTVTSTDTLCFQQNVNFNITGSPAGAYDYLWSPSAYLNFDTVSNPVASITIPGNYTYFIGITSPFGCLKKDTVEITVLPEIITRTVADTILCLAQSATLIANGGSVFTWNVISGPAMVIGVNFSCNPCATAFATPLSTTVYQVTSNLNGTCINKDTITVTVVPDFTTLVSQSETITCLLQDPIQININASPTANYSYQWETSSPLNNYTIPNPLTATTASGVYVYIVSVTNPLGCVKKDSAIITITPSYKPDPIINVSANPVCLGDTVQLGVGFLTTIPANCGISASGCAATTSAIVGTGTATNSSTDWPAPYGNWYTAAKHQFLFTATELNAAGITGGKINQIDFNVLAINGITLYHEYTIKMGCTNATNLSAWESGLFTVYTPKNHTVTTGWNAHLFDSAFEWDGVSNVIVEICFDETPGPNYTYNCETQYTTTSFISSLYDYSDIDPACPNIIPTFAFTQSSNRPNVKFHFCSGAIDSTLCLYNWFPSSGGIFNTNQQFTDAIALGQTNYYVIVTDTLSGCYDTAFYSLLVNAPTGISVNAGSDITICPGTTTLLTATGTSNYSWSPPTALSSTNTASTNANPSSTITYTVTGNSVCSTGPAIDSLTVTVFAGQALAVNAGIDQDVCGSTSFTLSAISSGGFGNNSYTWALISGTTADSIVNSNLISAYVIPSAENINTYQVTVVDTCGNTASDIVIVNVIIDCKLKIPNVFTPNGDGINDIFLISGLGIKTFSASIFDRWGREVFRTIDIKESWDGKDADDGTYYYIIKAESIIGKQFDEKGFFLRLEK